MLFRVFSTHYAPKDSHEALAYVVSCADDEALIDWLDEHTQYGGWKDRAEEDGEGGRSISIDDPTDDDRARVAELGLTIEHEYAESYSIRGSFRALLRFNCGDYFEEVSDLYYGATQYRWEVVPDVDLEPLRLALGDRFVEVAP